MLAAALAGFWKLGSHGSGSPATWPDPLRAPEARALLRSECRLAEREGRPLLVEFSAPWCEHCQAVKQTLAKSDVSDLLSRFHGVVFNIGNDDELDDLRRELEARAIPAWIVVHPDRCDAEPRRWKRLGNTYPRGDESVLEAFLKPLAGG